MTRTKTPAPSPDVTTPDPVPDPPAQDVARPSPVLAWPAEWPVPELPAEKQRRTRGLPMAPALAGAGNGATLAATAAYSAGGPVAAAATGVVVAAGAAVAVLRRRATVRRGMAGRAGGGTTLKPSRSGGGSGLRSGSSGSTGRGGSGSGRGLSGGRSGAGGGLRGALRRSGSGSPAPGSRGAAGSGAQRSRGGLLDKHGSGRHLGPGRHDPGSGAGKRQQKKTAAATEKAAKKALKQAAKNLAAKDTASKANSSGTGHALKAAAGRAARAAYNAGRPLVARASKTAAVHTRRAGGALWDGLCAAAAAGWSWLRRDRHAALDRLKAVWKRRRALRKTSDQPDTPTTPAVADTVRRPTTTTPAPSGGTRMSGGGHHFVAPAMELARAAANYQPHGMLQVGADFAGLEEALRLHAEAMKITVENADANFPLDPNIVELMRQIHGLQLKAADLAGELTPAFRQLHDVDISRLENPRKGIQGERMWDVSTNL